jgi:hypothetical protein
MKKLTRLFLLCVMMIAIPVQGIAATAMLCCGAQHHQSAATDDNKPNSAQHDFDGASHTAHDDASKADKCSSCADCLCCTPVSTPSNPVCSNLSSEKISSIFPSCSGHVADGLERPPRT